MIDAAGDDRERPGTTRHETAPQVNRQHAVHDPEDGRIARCPRVDTGDATITPGFSPRDDRYFDTTVNIVSRATGLFASSRDVASMRSR